MTAAVNVNDRAWAAAEAYAKKFNQVEVDEDEGGGDEGAEEEERAADGAGASGARRPELPPVSRCTQASSYLSIFFGNSFCTDLLKF